MSTAILRNVIAWGRLPAVAASLALAPSEANAQIVAELSPAEVGSPVLASDDPSRPQALRCLTQAIYYEAATEPRAGQEAVAQVVLNRLKRAGFPKTVCGVVFEGSQRATGCQFTFTCDGSLARRPIDRLWDVAEAVAEAALNGHVAAQVGDATHYHTAWVSPGWSRELAFVGQIGAHLFYRMSDRPAGPALLAQLPPSRAPAASTSAADFDVWGLKVATLARVRGRISVAPASD